MLLELKQGLKSIFSYIYGIICFKFGLWAKVQYADATEQDIKKLYTSSNFTPFRPPLAKYETNNPIDVGKNRF